MFDSYYRKEKIGLKSKSFNVVLYMDHFSDRIPHPGFLLLDSDSDAPDHRAAPALLHIDSPNRL